MNNLKGSIVKCYSLVGGIYFVKVCSEILKVFVYENAGASNPFQEFTKLFSNKLSVQASIFNNEFTKNQNKQQNVCIIRNFLNKWFVLKKNSSIVGKNVIHLLTF